VKKIVIAGGIGAGKSAATDYLAGRGFGVVDADDVARAITQEGEPAWYAIRDAFGDAVLRADESLDRSFIADIVFHDPSALKRLNAITHPRIGEEIVRRIHQASSSTVFIALPLFRPEHRQALALDEVWAVLVSADVATSRLVEHRQFTAEDVQARLANQMTNEERASLVDQVIWNNGTLEELHTKLDEQLARLGLVRG
jgi:dephospho-CoA kinase